MKELNLRNDEFIVYQEYAISYTYNNRNIGTRELYLTNYNLILVERSVFKKQVKSVIKYSLSDINIINDTPYVRISDVEAEDLIISINKDMITLCFDTRREAKKWQCYIISMMTGEKLQLDDNLPTEILGSAELANALYDTVDIFKGVFGKKEPIKQQTIKEVKTGFTSKNCIGCGAPINGKEGSIIQCEYCDTQQQL